MASFPPCLAAIQTAIRLQAEGKKSLHKDLKQKRREQREQREKRKAAKEEEMQRLKQLQEEKERKLQELELLKEAQRQAELLLQEEEQRRRLQHEEMQRTLEIQLQEAEQVGRQGKVVPLLGRLPPLSLMWQLMGTRFLLGLFTSKLQGSPYKSLSFQHKPFLLLGLSLHLGIPFLQSCIEALPLPASSDSPAGQRSQGKLPRSVFPTKKKEMAVVPCLLTMALCIHGSWRGKRFPSQAVSGRAGKSRWPGG